MKLFSIISCTILFSILLVACEKDTTHNEQEENYNFSDLNPGESIIDSIISLNPTPLSIIHKFRYINKTTISSIDFGYNAIQEPFNKYRFSYTNNQIREISYKNFIGMEDIVFKTEFTNNRISRLYRYPIDFPDIKKRNLGTYYTYVNNKISEIKYVETNSMFQRDSITIKFIRNSNNDIERVVEPCKTCNPVLETLLINFTYGSTQNKLATISNLKTFSLISFHDLAFKFVPISYDFINIEGYFTNFLNFKFIDELFSECVLTSKFLPTVFYYKNNPFYLKYKFNSNNYITSIAIGSIPNFNHENNERVRIVYHTK